MKRSRQPEVEIQVTPMLDMAFQLLTFFILTYHPTPVEGQFAMNLLPAAPALEAKDTPAASADTTPPAGQVDLPSPVRTLTTTIRGDENGGLALIQIGENQPMNTLEALSSQVKNIFGSTEQPFEQVLIEVDPRLKYADLMKVINVFATENVTKISFSELNDSGGPPP